MCWCFAEEFGLHGSDGFLWGGVSRQKSDKEAGGEELIITVGDSHQGMYNIKHGISIAHSCAEHFRVKVPLNLFTDRFGITNWKCYAQNNTRFTVVDNGMSFQAIHFCHVKSFYFFIRLYPKISFGIFFSSPLYILLRNSTFGKFKFSWCVAVQKSFYWCHISWTKKKLLH